MVTDRRYTESRERVDLHVEALARLAHEYHTRVISEAVYRASLFAKGLRGRDITTEVNLNWPDPLPVAKEKYRVENGKVVLNV